MTTTANWIQSERNVTRVSPDDLWLLLTQSPSPREEALLEALGKLLAPVQMEAGWLAGYAFTATREEVRAEEAP